MVVGVDAVVVVVLSLAGSMAAFVVGSSERACFLSCSKLYSELLARAPLLEETDVAVGVEADRAVSL